MMFENNPTTAKARPFPWRCVGCGAMEVYPIATDYTAAMKHDTHIYAIRVPDLAIPTCGKCGSQTFSIGDDDRLFEALRSRIGLLTPQEIRQGRGGKSPNQLAAEVGVDPETISRWEEGAMIQSRTFDIQLRSIFECAEARGEFKPLAIAPTPNSPFHPSLGGKS